VTVVSHGLSFDLLMKYPEATTHNRKRKFFRGVCR